MNNQAKSYLSLIVPNPIRYEVKMMEFLESAECSEPTFFEYMASSQPDQGVTLSFDQATANFTVTIQPESEWYTYDPESVIGELVERFNFFEQCTIAVDAD